MGGIPQPSGGIVGKTGVPRGFVSDCQIVWYSNGGLKTGLKKSLFMVQNVRYSNGPPSHMTLPFEYRTPVLSSIQVFSIQMVTVVRSPMYFTSYALHRFSNFSNASKKFGSCNLQLIYINDVRIFVCKLKKSYLCRLVTELDLNL